MQRGKSLFERANISDALVDEIRAMIVDGRLPAGERLNEVHLAARLGVSRTPLREALGRLTVEGALAAVPRIGYFVRPLTVDEFEQIYPIRAVLDPEALRLAGVPEAARLGRLEDLNERILAAGDADDVIALDDAWHLELLAGCPNKILLELVEQFMRRTRRYELALMREGRNVRVATDEHARIVGSLRAGELEAACDALRRNMLGGTEHVVAWLAAREREEERK